MFGPHGGPVSGAWDCGRAKVERSRVAMGIRESCPHYSKEYPSMLGTFVKVQWLLSTNTNGFVMFAMMIIIEHCFFGSHSLSSTLPSQSEFKRKSVKLTLFSMTF